MNKRKSVLGFIFTPNFQKVLLIHKNRPDWQKGKLNGLGGKLNPKETKEDGIQREVQEESSLIISQWKFLGTLENNEDLVYVLSTVYGGRLEDALTTTDEKVDWYLVDNLPKNIHSNLSWLIPFCMDFMSNKRIKKLGVFYKD